MDLRETREAAWAAKEKAVQIYDEIHKGERGIEDIEQADALIAESEKLAKLLQGASKADQLTEYFDEGVGSVTAGVTAEDTAPIGQWKDFGEFILAVTAAGNPKMDTALRTAGYVTDETMAKLEAHQRKDLEEATGSLGGYLVPIEYRPELYAKAAEAAIVRPRATVIPMSTRQILMPSLDQTTTPSDQLSAFFGGLYFQWIEEGQAKPEVEVAFRQIELCAHELAGWLPVSNNLIADSAISVDALIRNLFSKCMADAEDYWYLQGDGVGKPFGVIHSPATIQVARAGAGAIVWADIIAMLHAFEPGNGVWVAHICTMEQLLCLQDANSNYMWIPNMRDGMPERLMGYPLIFSEKPSALGSKGDIGLYDFSYYLIGNRSGPAVEASVHERFRYNQTTYRISMRIDGKPWLSAPVPLRPAGLNSISPFVTLDEYGA